jgi:hypothetical protein
MVHPTISSVMQAPIPEVLEQGTNEEDVFLREPSSGNPSDHQDSWQIAYKMLKSQDERMVKDYDDDINALLVFVRQLYA